MARLDLGIDVKDFDLDRIGFSISVLDESGKKRLSEGYLRMTLLEFDAFLRALKAAKSEIRTVTVEPDGLRKFMAAGPHVFAHRDAHNDGSSGHQEDETVPKLPLRAKTVDAAE